MFPMTAFRKAFCGETKEKALFLSPQVMGRALFLIIPKNPSLRLNNGYICDCLKEIP